MDDRNIFSALSRSACSTTCCCIGNIILTGDFNARTGTLLDFVFHDDGSIDKNYCQTPDNYIHDQANLRNNIDNISNESGKLLYASNQV